MLVVRFKVRCRPERTNEVRAALADVIAASRALDGVIHFDIAQDLADPNSFIATEIYDDRRALDRQEALPEVIEAITLIRESLPVESEATIFHISSSERYGSSS